MAESDSELAETLRLLEVHPSFWDRKTGFLQWQFLRRQPRYRRRITTLYKKQPNLYSRRNTYLKNYPKGIGEHFSQWARDVRNPKPRRVAMTSREVKKKINERVRLRVQYGRASRPFPVHPDIQFPHPDALESLKPHGWSVAVFTVPTKGTIRINLARIVDRPRALYVDPFFSLRSVLAEVRWDCDYFQLRRPIVHQVLREVKDKFLRLKRPRIKYGWKVENGRKVGKHLPISVIQLIAFDLKQQGFSLSKIARILLNTQGPTYTWDSTFSSGQRTKPLDVVKNWIASAKKKIEQAL